MSDKSLKNSQNYRKNLNSVIFCLKYVKQFKFQNYNFEGSIFFMIRLQFINHCNTKPVCDTYHKKL